MKIRIISTAIVLSIIMAVSALGQDIPFFWGNKWNGGSRAAGMGGAYTGVARGEGAFIYNPAGLGLAGTTEIYAAFSRISIETDAEVLGTSSTETAFNSGINSIGIVVPLPTSRGSLVFGIGYNKVQSFDRSLFGEFFNSSPNDSVTQAYSEVETGSLGRTAIGFSMEVAPAIFIGGSLNFWSGQNDFTSQFSETDEPFDLWTFSNYYETLNILTKFSASNFTIGTLIKSSPMLSLGATIESPLTLHNAEDWSYEEKTVWDDASISHENADMGDYEYSINSPWKYRVGGSVNIGPLIVAADFEFNDYSKIKFEDDPPSGDSKIEANLNIRQSFINTIDYSVGGEFAVPNTGIALRGGYSVRNSPFKNASSADDRKYISFGCGITVNPKMILNISYTSTSWSGSIDETVRKEDIKSSNIIAGFLYKL